MIKTLFFKIFYADTKVTIRVCNPKSIRNKFFPVRKVILRTNRIQRKVREHYSFPEKIKKVNPDPGWNKTIPCELLRKGRHRRRFHSPHTYPYQPLLFRSLLILQTPDTRLRRFRRQYTFFCQQLLPHLSLHNNGFRWTNVDTRLTVNAHLLIDFRLFVFNGDS